MKLPKYKQLAKCLRRNIYIVECQNDNNYIEMFDYA